MNRFNTHLTHLTRPAPSDARLRTGRTGAARWTALIGAGLILTATISGSITGCGTGQIAQTTDQAPAVNGTEGVRGHVALRNVRILAVQQAESPQPGDTVDLAFVATNQSSDVSDELTDISTEVGKVALAGANKLPARGVLMVAAPDGRGSTSPAGLKQLRGVEDADAATATVTLDKPITNGLTYGFTFDFKEAGPIHLSVPISAEETMPAATSVAPRPHR